MPDGERIPAPSDNVQDADTAANQPYGWDAKTRKKWEQLLLDEGLIQPGQYNFSDLVQLWQGAVQESAKFYAAGKKITPQAYVRNFLGSNGVGGNGVGSGPKTTTNTQSEVQHFDNMDAKGIATDTYQSELGRAALPDETRALHAALNAYAQAHPAITTQTTTNDGNGNSHTSSTTKGGVNAQDVQTLSQEKLQATPEYGSYQAAATYFPLLQQAISATANV